jgi:hypothetical protein
MVDEDFDAVVGVPVDRATTDGEQFEKVLAVAAFGSDLRIVEGVATGGEDR